HAGARGLMQILPRTAYNVAKRLRIRYSRKRLTTDPEYNLTLGLAYIEGLLRTFDGSYVLALAAYNAGPKRVRRWIEHYGDPRSREVNVIDWLELVPLSETRNYIQRVLEAIPVYRALLGEPGPRQGLAVDLIRGTETPPT
ncbi:MAG: lytic transglycosylase domain-containing protein, partial [Alphaproteobacteria bacterium]